MNTPDYNDVKTQYILILTKLRATIDKYKYTYPELLAIEVPWDIEEPAQNSDKEYLERLQELCAYLNDLGTSSYTIRHLHSNLCSDVEAVGKKAFSISQDGHYIVLPT